ncbi:MAG: GGDEF domain-containing protein [Shewanella sp.]|nr:GGDEF domain-containing protein [Shewanella sp.]
MAVSSFVNDTFGHDVGDDVLKLISKVLKSNFRKKDLIVRNGGEEFCVVLDDLTLEKSIDIFEKLIKKIESTPYEKDGVVINITVSIGLFHGIKNDIKSMLSLADKNLYVAKENGRNKLVSSWL